MTSFTVNADLLECVMESISSAYGSFWWHEFYIRIHTVRATTTATLLSYSVLDERFQSVERCSKDDGWCRRSVIDCSTLKATKIGVFTRESVQFNAVSLKKYFSFITAKISRLWELCEGSVDSNTSALAEPWWTRERSESTGCTAWKQAEESPYFPSGESS